MMVQVAQFGTDQINNAAMSEGSAADGVIHPECRDRIAEAINQRRRAPNGANRHPADTRMGTAGASTGSTASPPST
jgi:hypothetical protein